MHTFNLRKMIAMRLRELMDASIDMQTQEAVAKRSGMAQTTVGRILKQQVAATIDNIESIARAFNVEATELIATKPVSYAMYEWQRQIESLHPDDRERIFQFIRFTIDQSKSALTRNALTTFIKSEPLPPAIESSAINAARRSVKLHRGKSLNHEEKAGKTATVKSNQNKL
jgi:transcriptional regulator with XRE-family HTH domain